MQLNNVHPHLSLRILLASTVLVACTDHSASKDQGVDRILNRAGVSVLDAGDLTEDDAARLLDVLLPKASRESLCDTVLTPKVAQALLSDYGERGKLLSLQQQIVCEWTGLVKLVLESPSSIALRHKIVIGTDFKNQRMLKKESRWPHDEPFERTYAFIKTIGKREILVGMAFFEGAYLYLELGPPSSREKIDTAISLTWSAANALRLVYDNELKAYSENPSFESKIAIERPDLPDPDIDSPTHWPE